MLSFLDYFLDRTTMYRLVLYYLIALLMVAMLFSFFGILSYSPVAILFSSLFLVFVSWVTNRIFSFVFEAPTNIESVYITALILALIITPTTTMHGYIFLGWVGVLSMASKYIVAIGKKHIFNPVAIAVAITAIGIHGSASWWVGTGSMAIPVLLGGLLIVKKIRREDLVFSFFLFALVVSFLFSLSKGTSLVSITERIFLDSSLLFLGFVMLTEPLTTPPTRKMRILYGALVGVFFSPLVHIGSVYMTPELALLIGNIFAYSVSPKQKLILHLKEKLQAGAGMTDFVFSTNKKPAFVPGQYMEWTLSHAHADSRGNRRYFTIASSPTEDNLRLGVKFYENSSSYKKALKALSTDGTIVAAQLAGEFILPKNREEKCVFVAGGIGVTPFRSMIRYLVDTNEKRDIVLLYSNKTADEIMYEDVFTAAWKNVRIKTIYTLTDTGMLPEDWNGEKGRIDASMIKRAIPDYTERVFYISGPHAMVSATKELLKSMGIPGKQIKTDFFPGLV